MKRKIPKVRLKAPKIVKRLPRPKLPRRSKAPELKMVEAIKGLPRITNETVAEHREEVLSSARKYKYPLTHSRRRILVITVSLCVLAVAAFFVYCGLALYKFQATDEFIYRVTRVIPFPIAKVGSNYVAYENYLFELKRYMHYYETQQKVDLNSGDHKQLDALKEQAMQQTIDNAYIKQLAVKNHVSVSNSEVNNEIALVRSQNRLGSSNQVFSDVLKEFWGWSVDDFRRELRQQLLAQKVVSKLDTATWQRAQSTLKKLQGGADFGDLAAKVSDDASTKSNGGEYGFLIDKSNRDIAPQAVQALFNLHPGQISGIINTGYSLEIDKVIEVKGDKVRAAHIVFNLKDINSYIQPLKAREKPHEYLKV